MNKNLWLYILVAMFAGIIAGGALNVATPALGENVVSQITHWVALPGYFFIAIFKLLVIPLIVASIIMAFAGHDKFEGLQKLGLTTIGYFLVTTVLAIVIGISMALFINPASLIDPSVIPTLTEGVSAPGTNAALTDASNLPKRLVSALVTANPFATLAKGEMLRIVIFAIAIGIGMLMLPMERRKILAEPIAVIQEACMAVITWTLKIAPFAVFGLLMEVTTKLGFSIFGILGGFVATVLGGLLTVLLVYAFILKIMGVSPVDFFKKVRPAQLIAFSSSSSSATMPVTLQVAGKELRLPESVYRFVIPLGAIVNMNGTALFQAAAAVFLASVFGVELGMMGIVLIIVLALAAAIGTPTSPSSGLVTLTTILVAVGVPAEAVLVIVGIDRILDMCRTTVNVTGDLVSATVISKMIGEQDSSKES